MLSIYRVCAYLFAVRDLWLIADVPQVARVCFVVKSGNVKQLTNTRNTTANSGNVSHPGELRRAQVMWRTLCI